MNDTDLHLAVQNMYVELEMVDLRAQAELLQHKLPSRSNEAMIRDLVQIWRTPGIHEQAVPFDLSGRSCLLG